MAVVQICSSTSALHFNAVRASFYTRHSRAGRSVTSSLVLTRSLRNASISIEGHRALSLQKETKSVGKRHDLHARRVRSSAAAAAAEESGGADGGGTLHAESTEHERQELKRQLRALLEGTDGNLGDESLKVIEALVKLNPTPEPASSALFDGYYQMLNSSLQGVLYRGALVSLGRTTFNAFAPADLTIRFQEVYNGVGLKSADEYTFVITFQLAQEGLPPLEGLIINGARSSVESSNRRAVEFLSSTLVPRYPERDLDAWLRVFKESNPDMDERGVARKELGAKGWFDTTYLDADIRISVGNFGTTVVVQRLEAPAVEY